jgi:hypothetical protein
MLCETWCEKTQILNQCPFSVTVCKCRYAKLKKRMPITNRSVPSSLIYSGPSLANSLARAIPSRFPLSTLTKSSNGKGAAIKAARKKNAYYQFHKSLAHLKIFIDYSSVAKKGDGVRLSAENHDYSLA